MEKFVEGRLFTWIVGPTIGCGAMLLVALLIPWIDEVLSVLAGGLTPLAALLFSFVGGMLGDWASTPPWAVIGLCLLIDIYRRMA